MPLDKKHILYIQDYVDDFGKISSVFGPDKEDGDFELHRPKDLSEAMSKIAEGDIDAILLGMDRSDQHALDKLSRLYDLEPSIPIIILGSLNNLNSIKEGIEIGAYDYLLREHLSPHLLSRVISYAINSKSTEFELKDAKTKLTMLDKLKSDFLSTVSHELRTPVAIMREGVSLCLDGIAGELNETQKELLTHTLDNVDRLSTLISDLLDVSKIESGKVKLSRSSINLSEIIDGVYKRYEPQCKDKDLKFVKNMPKGPVSLYADHEKIDQIYDNLMSNAIQFTKKGGEIKMHVIEKRDVVECQFTDTGIGIEKKNLPKLFSKFQQFGRTEGPGYKGTGLGLSIIKGLIDLHDGKIWVDSEFGKGTTFSFTLKKVPFPKILIVDDEKAIVEVIQRVLKNDQYGIEVAYDGEKAVEIAQRETISLVILDMVLPGMSGYEVIGRLKQDVRTTNIPILISSGYSVDEERLNEVHSHGAIPIVHKPVEPVELRSKVKKMLMNS